MRTFDLARRRNSVSPPAPAGGFAGGKAGALVHNIVRTPAILRQTSPYPQWSSGQAAGQAPPQPYSPGLTAEELQRLEKHIKDVMQQLGVGKKEPEKSDTDKLKDGFAKALEGFFETPAGKKLKDKMLSKEGIGATIVTITDALIIMAVNKTDIPSIPEIPIKDNIKLKVDFEGTFDKPKSVKLTLKVKFGGPPDKVERPKTPEPPEIPAPARAGLEKVDPDLLRRHTIARTSEAYVMSGPDQEKAAKRALESARDLPDASLVAEVLTRRFLSPADETILEMPALGPTTGWDAEDLEALQRRLEMLVKFVAEKVPPPERVQLVKFNVEGRQAIYVNIKRATAGKDE